MLSIGSEENGVILPSFKMRPMTASVQALKPFDPWGAFRLAMQKRIYRRSENSAMPDVPCESSVEVNDLTSAIKETQSAYPLKKVVSARCNLEGTTSTEERADTTISVESCSEKEAPSCLSLSAKPDLSSSTVGESKVASVPIQAGSADACTLPLQKLTYTLSPLIEMASADMEKPEEATVLQHDLQSIDSYGSFERADTSRDRTPTAAPKSGPAQGSSKPTTGDVTSMRYTSGTRGIIGESSKLQKKSSARGEKQEKSIGKTGHFDKRRKFDGILQSSKYSDGERNHSTKKALNMPFGFVLHHTSVSEPQRVSEKLAEKSRKEEHSHAQTTIAEISSSELVSPSSDERRSAAHKGLAESMIQSLRLNTSSASGNEQTLNTGVAPERKTSRLTLGHSPPPLVTVRPDTSKSGKRQISSKRCRPASKVHDIVNTATADDDTSNAFYDLPGAPQRLKKRKLLSLDLPSKIKISPHK